MAATVSLAMIVRDESEQLGECLDSVRDLVDEICVVDTGSKDNTLEIARQHGARLSVFIWCDDFAAARNESLRMCTSDWIFVLDADERVAPKDIAKLRALTRGAQDCCYRITTRNYTNTESVSEFQRCAPDDPHARGFAGWYPSVKGRLFPNSRGGRFEGRVHELVNPSLERAGIRILDSDVVVHHYALLKSPERIRQKQEMYVQLGHEKVASEPGDPKGFAELGNQYAELGDYANAAGAYRKALALDPSNPLILKDLGGMLHLLKRNADAKRSLSIALDFDPSLVDAWRNLGVVYADEKEWEQAIDCFEQALELDRGWTDGHRFLSAALEGGGRLEDAAAESWRALEANSHSREALSLFLHQMLRLERRADARKVILGLLEKNGERPDLHNALGELYYYDNLFEEAKAHFQRAADSGLAAAFNNLGVVHFKERDFEEAREAFERCLSCDPGHRGARSSLAKVLKHLSKNG
ncbi:MAG: tetratricopeptide repeat protein [Candidatus Hydrogenedentes bacterium]|nr:tetratricopeptide repeat protein [Candidatus Hydrogenedentota bacterium]